MKCIGFFLLSPPYWYLRWVVRLETNQRGATVLSSNHEPLSWAGGRVLKCAVDTLFFIGAVSLDSDAAPQLLYGEVPMNSLIEDMMTELPKITHPFIKCSSVDFYLLLLVKNELNVYIPKHFGIYLASCFFVACFYCSLLSVLLA